MDANCFFFSDVVDARVPSGIGYFDVGQALTGDECDTIFSYAKDFETPRDKKLMFQNNPASI